MYTTLNPLSTTTTHNTILLQRSSRPLRNHTGQHGPCRRQSLHFHIRSKLVIIGQQPDSLCTTYF